LNVKRKLRTYTKQIHPEEIRFPAKKWVLFYSFTFGNMLEDPLKFSKTNFHKISKKKIKNGSSWGFEMLRGIKS
jgi:hypothetical protein